MYTQLCNAIVTSGCELSKEKPTAKFEIEADDDDEDFLCHTLFLKQVNYRPTVLRSRLCYSVASVCLSSVRNVLWLNGAS